MADRIPFRFAPIPDEMLFNSEIPSDVLRLWAAVYRSADRAGVASISRLDLGASLGWSDSTVGRWAKRAKDMGYLDVVRVGLGKPNEYRAILPPDQSELIEPTVQKRPVGTVKTDRSTQSELTDPSLLLEISNTENTATADAVVDSEPGRLDLGSRAMTILREAWELQTPRPQQSFIGARKVIEKALRDGWPDADVRQAIVDDGFPVTGARLDIWRSRRNGRRPQSKPATAVVTDWSQYEGIESGVVEHFPTR